MKHIIYECGLPNTLSGGFGDRLIGIASCLSLCEKFNSKLLIKWHDINLHEHFDYKEYNYFNHNIGSEGILKIVNHSCNELKQIFNNKLRDDFKCENLIFNTNQNLWQFLYEFISHEEYEQYTYNLFKKIFDIYLIPNNQLKTKINEIMPTDNVIGIQLRFGDVIMNQENRQINNPQYDHFPLGNNIDKIKDKLLEIIHENRLNKVFIASDINISKILDLSKITNIIYFNKNPVHIERTENKDNLDKCFIDFFALCKCKKLFITFESNFGRIPAIMVKDNIKAIESNLNIRNVNINELACKNY